MSASDTELCEKKRLAGRQAIIYIAVSLFCGLFSAVYEHFSHKIYSDYMIWLFAFPAFLGALPYIGISLSERLPMPSRQAAGAWDCGIMTLTLGSCVRGVLDIYGTSASLTAVYFPTGLALLAAGLLLYLHGIKNRKQRGAET